jgi:hypothetical protein
VPRRPVPIAGIAEPAHDLHGLTDGSRPLLSHPGSIGAWVASGWR